MSKAKIDIARGDESNKNGVKLVTITGARPHIDMAKVRIYVSL